MIAKIVLAGALIVTSATACSTGSATNGASSASPSTASPTPATASQTPSVSPSPTSASPTPAPTSADTTSALFPPGYPKDVTVAAMPKQVAGFLKTGGNVADTDPAIAVAPGVWALLPPGATVADVMASPSLYGWCASIHAYESQYLGGQKAGGACW